MCRKREKYMDLQKGGGETVIAVRKDEMHGQQYCESLESTSRREKEIRTTAVSTRPCRKKCPSLFTHTGMISSLLSVQRSKFSIVTY